MSNHRWLRCLLFPVYLLVLTSGCEVLHEYRPVAILVRDAETKKPIGGSEVRISYPAASQPIAPHDSVGTTGDTGIVQLRAAPYGELGVRVEGTANGYLADWLNLPLESIQALPAARLFGKDEPRPAQFILELYAQPGPTVELVVPAGHRGLIKAEVLEREDVGCAPGQRCFSTLVPPSGIVQVTLPGWARRFGQPDFVVKYTDGTPLPFKPRPPEVGYWWVKRDGTTFVYVIGNEWEFDAHRREMAREGGDSRVSIGPKSGNRHGHRGNPSAADASPGGANP
jgi:hypothetical protein